MIIERQAVNLLYQYLSPGLSNKTRGKMKLDNIKASFKDQRGEILDILERIEIDCVTLISSKKGAIRGNHYHQESIQYTYIISGKMRLLTQMPGEKICETILQSGDLVYTPPHERHTLIALDDSVFLALTKGPRGGKNYEDDTYRLTRGLQEERANE